MIERRYPTFTGPLASNDENVRTDGDGLHDDLKGSFAPIRDPSEQQQDDDEDSKSFAEIHHALSDTCRATSRACESLLELLTSSEKESRFASLYLALLTRDLFAATTTLQDMLGIPRGRQLQGANTIFFFTVCKKYLQAFLALVDEVRTQGANAEYIVILRPVQRLSRRAAQLIANSRWSTAGDLKMPMPG